MKKILRHTFLSLGMLLIFACSSTKVSENTQAKKDKNRNKMELSEKETNPEFALEMYLKKTPGVTVRGSGVNATVQIRGVNSFGGNTQPLFVINGNAIGSSYSAAADILRGMKIKSVEVLKGSDASLYGVRGSGGVIVIKAQ